MAFDAFLTLKHSEWTIRGESTDDQIKDDDAFELQSFTLQSNVDLSDETMKASGGKDKFTVKIKKDLDAASPDIFLAFCKQASKEGKSFDSATITVRKAAGSEQLEFLILKMENATISNWKLDTSDDNLPDESFDLNFKKLTYTYVPQRATGGQGTAKPIGWDFGLPGKI